MIFKVENYYFNNKSLTARAFKTTNREIPFTFKIIISLCIVREVWNRSELQKFSWTSTNEIISHCSNATTGVRFVIVVDVQ